MNSTQKHTQIFSRILAGLSMTIALAVTAGWSVRYAPLVQIHPSFPPMQFNTALMLGLGSASMIFLTFNRKRWALVFGLSVAVMASLFLSEYVTGIRLGIDELLVRSFVQTQTLYPGRPAPNTCLAFLILGISFGISARRERVLAKYLATALALFVLGLASGALIGYLFGIRSAYVWWGFTGMAVHTATGLLVLSTAQVVNLWKSGRGHAFALSLFMLSMCLSFVALIGLTNMQEKAAQARFEKEAGFYLTMYQDRMSELDRTTRAISAFFDGSDFVSPSEFEVFVHKAFVGYPMIVAFDWAPLVTAADRSAYEARQAQNLHHAFTLTEVNAASERTRASDRAEYYPVEYTSPADLFHDFLGFDHGSDAVRREAMDIAIAANAPVISRTNPIWRTAKVLPDGAYVFMPVFKTNEERPAERHIFGFVVAVVDLKKMVMNYSGGDGTGGVIVQIKNVTGGKSSALYTTDESIDLYVTESKRLGVLPLERVSRFEALGQEFEVRFVGGPEYLQMMRNRLPCLAFLLVLAVGILISGFVTALANQTAAVTSLLETIPDAILLTDRDGNVLKVNSQAEKLFGYTRKEFGSLSFSKLVVCAAGSDVSSDIPGRTVGKDKSGREFPVEVNQAFYASDRGSVTVAAVRDITARRQAERALREAIGAKTEFISVVSHELRTPLTIIKESVAIVEDGSAGTLNADQQDFLSTAKRNVDRLARLINDVLDFQKLGAGRMEFVISACDVNQTIRELERDLKTAAGAKGLELQTDLATNLPSIQADKDRITQVLMNYVNNAIKFTDRGKIVIGTAREGENAIRVWVQDQGPGIKPEDLPKLFQAFSQTAIGIERKSGGTGLGLAISKQIVEQHKGRVGVDSIPGQGATFFFVLPIQDRRGR